MITHDFEIPQGNVLPLMRQTLTLPGAVDLTGATAVLRHWVVESDVREIDATIDPDDELEDETEAEEFAIQNDEWDDENDTGTAGVRNFQWRITLSGGEILDLPSRSPRSAGENDPGDPDRIYQTFEIIPVES